MNVSVACKGAGKIIAEKAKCVLLLCPGLAGDAVTVALASPLMRGAGACRPQSASMAGQCIQSLSRDECRTNRCAICGKREDERKSIIIARRSRPVYPQTLRNGAQLYVVDSYALSSQELTALAYMTTLVIKRATTTMSVCANAVTSTKHM